MKNNVVISALIFTSLLGSLALNAVLLKDPDHNDNYLKAGSGSAVSYTDHKSDASDFTLENVTPKNLVGAVHYRITLGEKVLHLSRGGTLSLVPTATEEDSKWISVVHYLYFNQLRNGDKILVKEE
ncbi:TPA: hypothetical protein DDZ86_00360 [Candidatus Dependentiae bacterium]|nr:MAG: hypothetical protein UW09_C0002G0050 [candidate division TM6 bacterium GW2011_GWF2_43_87]HBL98081.1 hypothetical protein [Candidatus Dependentiae bacterium]